jgi:hypothetical protein
VSCAPIPAASAQPSGEGRQRDGGLVELIVSFTLVVCDFHLCYMTGRQTFVLHAAVEPANYKVLLHYHYPDACPFFPLYISLLHGCSSRAPYPCVGVLILL